ncbi:hypothetical protein EPA93_33300 [Ktedonosporobacter rubrisoli]|uniref:Uncharacterized protein n=1 Tax=Ktedonosporobacter rubrisoli TaxID=2509675 RepID=A0A4P6JXT9_KTERU|nr:hypothetical protein [Ktedonosporobacter rubrisoli]QBD80588.1 hypothetical protein EPA93_33300 [Ktedonosporobacter rubrisoli]
MRDTTDIVKLLSSMVDRVEPFDTPAAQRLKLLAEAIESEESAEIDAWAATDLYMVFEPDALVANFRKQQTPSYEREDRLIEIARAARNVLIFVPFILSFYALAQAANKYALLFNAQSSNASVPFLYLWEQGFNGTLPGWLTLSGAAFIDVVLLILIFALTLVMYLQKQARNAQREQAMQLQERDAQLLRSDLAQVLAATSLYLFKHRRPLTAGDNLEAVARRLESTTSLLTERLELVIARFDNAAQDMRRDLATLSRDATQKIEGMTQNVTANFEGMTLNVSERFAGMTENITTNFASLTQDATQKIEGMTQNVTTNFAGMTEDIEQNFAETTQSLSGRFEDISGNVVTELASLVAGISEKYDDMAQQIARRFGLLTNQLQEQLLAGNKYFKQLGNLTSGVVQTAEQMKQAADILQATHSELSLSISELAAPTRELAQQQVSLLDSATASTALLQSTASVMREMSQRQERWGTDLRNMLDTLDLTVERATDLILGVGDYTRRQDALLTQLQQEREAQTELVRQFSTVTQAMQSALTETTTGIGTLRAMAQQLEAQQHRPADVKMPGGEDTLQRYEHAAVAVERSNKRHNSVAETPQKPANSSE